MKSSTFSSLIDQFDVSQHADQSGIIITNMYLLWGEILNVNVIDKKKYQSFVKVQLAPPIASVV